MPASVSDATAVRVFVVLCAVLAGMRSLYAGKGEACNCLQGPAEALDAADMTGPPSRDMFAHLSDEEAALILEYWSEWPKLQEFYSNLQMTGRVEEWYSGAGSAVSEMTYYGNFGEGCFRLDVTSLGRFGEENTGDVDGGKPRKEIIGLLTPERQYVIEIDSATGQRIITGQTIRLELAKYGFCHYSRHDVAFADHFGFSLAPRLILNLPRHPNMKDARIESVRVAVDPDEGEIVTITNRPAPVRNPSVVIRTEFYRNRHWALKSYEYEGVAPETPAAGRHVIQCEYSGDYGSFPLLKSCTKESYRADVADLNSVQLVQSDRFTVQEIIPGPASADVFDVDALLGRKVQVTPPASPGFWWRPLLIVNGLILLGAAAWTIRKRRF